MNDDVSYHSIDDNSKKYSRVKLSRKKSISILVVVVLLLSIVAVSVVLSVRSGPVQTALTVEDLKKYATRSPAVQWYGDSYLLFNNNDSSWVVASNNTVLLQNASTSSFFSFDFSLAMTPTAVSSLFRHSFKATYQLVSTKSQSTLSYPFENKMLKNVQFDAKSNDFAVVDDNSNIFIVSNGASVQVTSDGSFNITNGVQNWLYEEEIYSSSNAMHLSQRYLAYLKSDESMVPVRTLPLYAPNIYNTSVAERDHWFELYSRVGDPIPIVALHVFDRQSSTDVLMKTGPNPYIASFKFVDAWNGDLFVETLSRKQDVLDAMRCAVSDGTCQPLYHRTAIVVSWVDLSPIIWRNDSVYQLEQITKERVISKRTFSAIDKPVEVQTPYKAISLIGFDQDDALW
jgi:hypothetical protein